MRSCSGKTPFIAGNDGRPEEVAKALRGLRMMARLGRQAEAALRALERTGEHPGPVPVARRDGRHDGRTRYAIGSVRFPRRVELTAARALGMMRPSIACLHPMIRTVSGSRIMTFSVQVAGNILCCKTGEMKEGAAAPRGDLAIARIKSNGQVTLELDSFWCGNEKVLKVLPDSPKIRRLLAEAYAASVIRWDDYTRITDPRPLSQEAMAMMHGLAGWILEAGLPEQWLQQILDSAPVLAVMGA